MKRVPLSRALKTAPVKLSASPLHIASIACDVCGHPLQMHFKNKGKVECNHAEDSAEGWARGSLCPCGARPERARVLAKRLATLQRNAGRTRVTGDERRDDMGGKPSKGTKKDGRLKENGAKPTSKPTPKVKTVKR